jgi:serine O-acetyltransferase
MVPCGWRAIRGDFAHYCDAHRARSFFEKLLLPLRAPAFLALAVHRYGRWLKTARLPRPAKIPLVVLHLALFEIVRHATAVFLQPWVDVEERVWFGSFAPMVISAERIGSGARIYGGVTIGAGLSREGTGVPTIGRDVVIGPGAIVVGPVRVPDGTVVGPNTLLRPNALLTTTPQAPATFLGTPSMRTDRAPESLIPGGAV